MDAKSMPPDVRIKTLEPVLVAGRIVGEGETLDVSPTTAGRLMDVGAAVRIDGRRPMPVITSRSNGPRRLSDLIS